MGEAMVDMLVLICATCCDSFFMSVAYGAERIKIPWKATMIISLCGTMLLGLSIALAKSFTQLLSAAAGEWISFFILIALGLIRLFQAQVKHYVKKHKQQPLIIRFKGISFVIDIFLDETEADMDRSKELSVREAAYLGIALSLDSFASGLAFGIGVVNIGALLIVSFGFGIAFMVLGSALGKSMAYRFRSDVSWLSGFLLILLALLRLG